MQTIASVLTFQPMRFLAGAETSVRELAWQIMQDMDINIPITNFLLHGSHSHSGPHQ